MSYNNTDPSPYHEVIALSQRCINTAFKNMWALAQIDPNQNPLQHFNLQLRGGDYIDVDVGPPSVQLQLSPRIPILYFQLRLIGGKLFVYTTLDPTKNDHIDWTVEDEWVLAFSVTINQKKVEKGSQEYIDFQQKSGLSEDNFTLARLFIDASSTTTWKDELSNFGSHQKDWENLNKTAKSTIKLFVQQWLNAMSDAGKNILGYSAQKGAASDLDDYVPTFPPTSIDYYNYPWKNNPSDESTNNLDNNALCYLMMTNFSKPPDTAALAYSGQFIGDGHDATFTMHRDLFWGWMHGVLRQLVIEMQINAEKPDAVWNDHRKGWTIGPKWSVGYKNPTDSQFVFTSNGDKTWNWDFESHYEPTEAQNPENTESMSESDWSNTEYTYDYDPTPGGGMLSFTEGGAVINLTGKNTLKWEATYLKNNKTTKAQYKFVIEWNVQIAAVAVQNGGVVFQKTDDDNNWLTVTPTIDYDDLPWIFPVQSVVDGMQADLEKKSKSAFDAAETELTNGLGKYHRLLLPAAGTFLMKNPTFNYNGDLMVELAYNGDPPPQS